MLFRSKWRYAGLNSFHCSNLVYCGHVKEDYNAISAWACVFVAHWLEKSLQVWNSLTLIFYTGKVSLSLASFPSLHKDFYGWPTCFKTTHKHHPSLISVYTLLCNKYSNGLFDKRWQWWQITNHIYAIAIHANTWVFSFYTSTQYKTFQMEKLLFSNV